MDKLKEIWKKLRNTKLDNRQQVYLALIMIWAVVGILVLIEPGQPTKFNYAIVLLMCLISFCDRLIG